MATISFVIPPAWCIYILLYTSHCFILVPTCLNILGSVKGEGTNLIWHFKPVCIFLFQQTRCRLGEDRKKMLITLVGGWINFRFLLPWRCLQRFCCSFSLLFFLTRLPCNQQRDARLLFSLSIHSSIIFLTLCDSLIQVLQFNSSFPFWSVVGYLPILAIPASC